MSSTSLLKVSLASLSILIGGCAQQMVAPTSATRAELRGASLIRAIHIASEPLRVATPAVAIGGLVGWALDRELGKSWAKKAGADTVTDPIVGVKDRFAAALATQGAFPSVTVVPEPVADNGREAVQRALKDGLVFDFETKDWSLLQPSGFSADYQLVYKARVRLVRVQDWRVLWQAECDARGPTRSRYQAFTADGGGLLRAESAAAAEACDKQLVDRFGTGEIATVGVTNR